MTLAVNVLAASEIAWRLFVHATRFVAPGAIGATLRMLSESVPIN
jgi:acyl dehydratase